MAKKKEKDESIVEEILPSQLDDLMGDRFAIYAKDVIQNRAIPDCRDGLKPVQRRILYGMYVAGNTYAKPTKKCAHIVGDVMGKYHPHGDSSIYEALARMSQPWAMRYPLIDFQGNNGSIDGDSPAAYRYTEARLSSLSDELLDDLDYDTVDMLLTFDDSLEEPSVLPAHFPNLLANGAEGIAVGIATNIPPHNLNNLVETIAYRIHHPDCSIDELIEKIEGPDFPTGGIVYCGEGLKDVYRYGKGRFTIEAKKHEEMDHGHPLIVIDEIPYQVNKASLVKSIDKIRLDKAIHGIQEVRDETDREGMRIVVELRPEADPKTIYSYLLTKTDLRISYSAHIVAIAEGSPKTLSLIDYCDAYIQHELEVISRRSKHLWEKDKLRLEIVEGLLRVATDRGLLDEIVEVIKKSQDKADSKRNIQNIFGFSEPQAEAIVMMPLHRLSHGDVGTLSEERGTLIQEISDLEALIQHQDRRESHIIRQLRKIAKTYGGERRTIIENRECSNESFDKRSLIPQEDCYLVATRDGYLKRSSLLSYRNSKGLEGTPPGIKSGDTFIYIGKCTTKDYFLLFTNKGRFSSLPVHEIRSTKWNDEGFHVSSLIQLEDGERLIGGFVVQKFRSDINVCMLSKHGNIKRSPLDEFVMTRWNHPAIAFSLGKKEGDTLVDIAVTSGNDELIIASEEGRVAHYMETDISRTHIRSGGVSAGHFKGKHLVSLLAFSPEDKNTKFVVITDGGHLRVTDLSRYPLGKRISSVSNFLFNTLKMNPQRLLFLDKVGNKNAPFNYDGVIKEDKTRIDLTFEDWNLTPKELHARSDATLSKKRQHLYAVSLENSLYIDDSFVAHEPPSILPYELEEDDLPSEEYEQISLLNEEGE